MGFTIPDIEISDTVDEIGDFINNFIELLIQVVRMFADLMEGLADMKDFLLILIPAILIANVGIGVLKSFEKRPKN